MFAYRKTLSSIEMFMTERWGGVGRDNYASFNLSNFVGDDEETVRQNRSLLCKALEIPSNHLFIPKEVHGNSFRWISAHDLDLTEEERDLQLVCDALITTEPMLCLGVTTADCVPILLYNEQKTVVAAVHAGWRGVVGEILPNTIHEICSKLSLSPTSLFVEVNPCISKHNFEVGEEVVDSFQQVFSPQEILRLVFRTDVKPHIDLQKAVAIQAFRNGILTTHLTVHTRCTFDDDSFFSARRMGVKSGRMVSGVMIKS